jgi:hypothetical protein
LPPVTIATLPLRSKSPVFMIVIQMVFGRDESVPD